MALLSTESSVLSYRKKHWVLDVNAGDVSVFDLVPTLAKLRGIDLHASPKLSSPTLFPDMERATDRIERAIADNEKIAIFGDYDCDGITAVAQLGRFFRRRNKDPQLILPHRVHDGYGLHGPMVEKLAASGATLIITCDTGITAVEEIAELQKKGIDVIVTDHHHLGAELPPAYALLHPALTRHPKPYPSGAGVVLKLLHALEKGPWEGMMEDHALAMIGTVADLVELKGDNRAIVQLGLQALRELPVGPLKTLCTRATSGERPLSSTDIAFRIAPRINAAGRMSSPDIALRALLFGGNDLEQLDRLNTQRQHETERLLKEIVAEFTEEHLPSVLFKASTAYPHGILGLLAGKLTETYGRPSLVATIEGELCTASLRSPACYNITEALSRNKDLLHRFGGHAQAAGCTFAMSSSSALEKALKSDMELHVRAEDMVATLPIDAKLRASDISEHLIKDIARLEPFGQGNPEPRFLISSVSIDAAHAVGAENAHLQGVIAGCSCIGFHLGAFAEHAACVDIVARIGMNTWNGRARPQITIEDMREASACGPRPV